MGDQGPRLSQLDWPHQARWQAVDQAEPPAAPGRYDLHRRALLQHDGREDPPAQARERLGPHPGALIEDELSRRALRTASGTVRASSGRPRSVGPRPCLPDCCTAGRCGAPMAVEVARVGSTGAPTACLARISKEVGLRGRGPHGRLDRQALEYLGDRLFTLDRIREIVRQLSHELARLRQANSEKRASVQRQLLDVRQRMRRQYEAIETGAVDVALVGDRLRELKHRVRNLSPSSSSERVALGRCRHIC